MRKMSALVAGVLLASAAKAAVVTYTLSLHDSGACTVGSNAFTVYVTVSNGDNDGLFAFGVDLRGQGEVGGPTAMTLTNRSPAGSWGIDDADPNYDGGDYPSKVSGFSTGRTASNASGIVSGVQDLSHAANPPDGTPGNLVRLYGFGQTAHRMNDFKPPPAQGTMGPIAYKP